MLPYLSYTANLLRSLCLYDHKFSIRGVFELRRFYFVHHSNKYLLNTYYVPGPRDSHEKDRVLVFLGESSEARHEDGWQKRREYVERRADGSCRWFGRFGRVGAGVSEKRLLRFWSEELAK